jgi:hypothetical protein
LRSYLTIALAGALLLFARGTAPAPQLQVVNGQSIPVSSQPTGALSTRVVAYTIDAKLNTTNHSIDATETLVYRNLTGQPQQTFPFHLYLNAFQPRSTLMTEVRLHGARGVGSDSGWDEKHRASITINKFEVEGVDLAGKMQFIQPDDHNTNDHTVVQVTLPQPVAPGASVEFHITFHDELPEVLYRTGYKRDFYMIGQWFPKVGVWWKNAWNCHQFHADSEFFADFGTFDVNLTLPQNEIVGAAVHEVPFRRRARFLLDR